MEYHLGASYRKMVKYMPGWNLKNGAIKEYIVSEDRYWSLFNFVFSDSSRKRNSYKFGFMKALLDNLFNVNETNQGYYISYRDLFEKFAENYWNLVIKYGLHQMRRDGRSELSKIENILNGAVSNNRILANLEFNSIDAVQKEKIIDQVVAECKKCVVGALYEDFEGVLYSFNLKESGLNLAPGAYDFMLKYKAQLENLNYYSWAKFLEKVNSDNALVRVIDKLELATPKRSDLSIYREILRQEFEECNCFYCGRKLQKNIHVDHFIPWSFVKDDKIWNFVLSCPSCNERKNNRVPTKDLLIKLEERNKMIQRTDNILVQSEFSGYQDGLLGRMWTYAKISGLKEYIN